jgi:FkbM family methyltransferase
MKTFVKRLVAGTPFEPVARKMWQRLHANDAADPDDRLAFEILAKVLQKDSNCVDVGCATGNLLRHMVQRAPRGRHLAFEPIPANVAELRRSFPGVTVLQMALSDAPGEAEFNYVVSNPGFSGLRQRDYPRPDEEIHKIRVKVDCLDNVLPRDLKVTLVKVDVEGAELQVFRGARRLLGEQKPFVLFEHGRGAADHYGTTPEMVYDLLAGECGLRISLLGDFLAGQPPLSRDAFVAQFQGLHWNFIAHA